MFMQLPLSIRALEGQRFAARAERGMLQKDARCGCDPPQPTRNLVFGSTQNAARTSADRHYGELARLAEAVALASAATRVAAVPGSSNSRDSVIHRKLCEAEVFSTITRIAVGNWEIMSSTDANRTSKHGVPCSSRTAKRHDFVSCSRFLASSRTT